MSKQQLRRKIIIDVDTGNDDAQAIMMALSQTSVEVLAITCVSGNIDVEQVCQNTVRVLKVCDCLDIPVHKGLASSLIDEDVEMKQARVHHGKDGLGDVPDADPLDMSALKEEHAVYTLLRLTQQHPGKGNITTSAEFNFFCDPEAAHITLHGLGCPILLVSWETCLHNGLSWDWFEKWKTIDTPKSKFNQAIIANGVHRIRNVIKLPVYRSCDPAAMATVIDESIILESETVYCNVELQGRLTRGQMVLDWMGRSGKPANVTLVKRIDLVKFAHLMEDMVK